MCVAGELQRDAGGIGNLHVRWPMGEQHAGAGAIDAERREVAAKRFGTVGLGVVQADDLQAADLDGFIVQHAHADPGECGEVGQRIAEFIVVTGDEVGAGGRGELRQGGHRLGDVDLGSVEEVAGDKHGGGIERLQAPDNALHEGRAADDADMHIAHHGDLATVPRVGQIGQRDGVARDVHAGAVDHAVGGDERRKAEERPRQRGGRDGEV